MTLQAKPSVALDDVTAYGEELELVSTFWYLGRPLSTTDNDWPALYWNLRKARRRWAQVSRVLTREGSSPDLSGMQGRRLQNGDWVYPPVGEALEAAGLHPIETYIGRRRRYLDRFASSRPILDLCRESGRLSGTPTGTKFWWDQDPEEVVE